MRLKESLDGEVPILAMEGEIDLHYAPVLRALLQGKVREQCPALVVDFTEVDFIDSAGLGAIVEYFRDASRYDGVLCVTGLNENLRTVFEIVRLDRVIPVFATSAEAIAALREGNVRPPGEALFSRSAHPRTREGAFG
jgi:anti-anti-sigma factor